MKMIIIIFVLVFPGVALAGDWTTGDTALQLTYVAVTAADWSQTLHIARNPEQYHEKNPRLGNHPSTGSVNAHFISTIAVHTTIAWVLPKEYRTIWQMFWIGYEAGFVQRNAAIGLTLSF